MKSTKILLVLALAAAGLLATESATARSRVVVGVGIGVPIGYPYHYHYGWGPYYPYPYYYPPYYAAPVVVQQQPTVYVEQPQAQPAPAQPSGYWYYCGESRGYYPYVKECPGGWQRVSPQPAQ